MKKLKRILFLSCLKATELIEKSIYYKLGWVERLQLKIHKIICPVCEIYEKQSLLIEKGIVQSHKIKIIESDLVVLKKMIAKKLEEFE
jgi:hypothetical protein